MHDEIRSGGAKPPPWVWAVTIFFGSVAGAIVGLAVSIPIALLWGSKMDNYVFAEVGWYLVGRVVSVCVPLGAVIGGAAVAFVLSRSPRR